MKFNTGLISLLICFQVVAQSDSFYELEEIVHTQEQPQFDGIFTDENVDEVDEEEMENANVSSLDDVLRLTPAATTSRGPRTASEAPQVRGLDKGKISVSIDGMRQNFQEGHNSMMAMDVETLKTVNIFTSGADFAQSASLGGGVVFKTLDPEDLLGKSKQAYSLKTQFNSANEEQLLNLKAAFKEKGYSALASLSQRNANELLLSDESYLDNSSFNETSFLGKIKRKKLTFNYSYFNRTDDSPIDPSLNPPAELKSLLGNNKITRNSFSVKYNNSRTKGQVYLNQHNVEKINEESNVKSERQIQTLGLNLSRNYNNWNYGAEVYRDKLNGTKAGEEILSYPNANTTVASSFLQRKFDFNKLKIIPGIKLFHYQLDSSKQELKEKSAQAFSKNLLASYKLTEKIEFNGSYSEGFNPPKLIEMYPTGLHNPGDGFIFRDNYFIENPQLTHETSAQWEGGVKFSSNLLDNYDRFTLSYSAYSTRIENYIYQERIDRSVLDDEDGTTQFKNIPLATLYGAEAKIHYLNSFFDTSLSYSNVRGRNESLNLFLEDLPADHFTFNLNLYFDNISLLVGYTGIQTLKQDRVNPNTIQRTEETPGYLLHNAFLKKEIIENLDLNIRVDNLTNTKYRRHASHLYESGRDAKIALTYKFLSL